MYEVVYRIKCKGKLVGLVVRDKYGKIHHITSDDAKYLAFAQQLMGVTYVRKSNSLNYATGLGRGRQPAYISINPMDSWDIPWETIAKDPYIQFMFMHGAPKVIGLVLDIDTGVICGFHIAYSNDKKTYSAQRTITVKEAIELSKLEPYRLHLHWVKPIKEAIKDKELLKAIMYLARQAGIPNSDDFFKVNLFDSRITPEIAHKLYPNNITYVKYNFGFKFISERDKQYILQDIQATYITNLVADKTAELQIPLAAKLEFLCEAISIDFRKDDIRQNIGFIVRVDNNIICVDTETMKNLIRKLGKPSMHYKDYRYIYFNSAPYSVERRLVEDKYILTLYR